MRQERSAAPGDAPGAPHAFGGAPARSRAPGGSRLALLTLGFGAIFGCLLALGALAEDVREQESIALDGLVTPLLHGVASPTLDAVMGALTNLGSTVVIVPLLAVALALLAWRRQARAVLFLIAAMAGSVALNQSLKLIFHRARPQLAWAQVQPEFSFPSGHAMNSLVLYGALALVTWGLWGRRAGLIAGVASVVLAVLIGTSRIYLGYHYFTDVAGGLLAGTAWLLLVTSAFRGRPSSPARRGPPRPDDAPS